MEKKEKGRDKEENDRLFAELSRKLASPEIHWQETYKERVRQEIIRSREKSRQNTDNSQRKETAG